MLKSELKELKLVCGNNIILKIILETALLNSKEIKQVCEIAKSIKVDFVKTSTGFSTRGANLEDIKLMKSIVQDEVCIKASGGIKSYKIAKEMIVAGANRLGTSSGIAIINGENENGGSY